MIKRDNHGTLVIVLLSGLCAFVWGNILFRAPTSDSVFYFLDVGQGDSELVVFPGNVKVMTDAGPDQKIVRILERAIGSDAYVDIAIVSHPQLDHFNGFNYLLEKYRFGAFIVNGRDGPETVEEWPALLKKIKERNIPLITLRNGDRISHQSSTIDIISPNQSYLQSGELNDTGLVEFIKTGAAQAIFAADIGAHIEEYIVKKFDIEADILKIPHHGSKYSSSETFLKAVGAKVAVVEVGKSNSYGHPAPETLERLESAAPNIFRTDQSGTIRVVVAGNTLSVFTER